jgi:hypothetical protein
MDDLSAYAADAELSQAEAGDVLAQITRTARELREAQADVESAQEQLKVAQDRVRNLTENQLPLLMDEAQQKRLTTSDGWDIVRSEVVRAGISRENMPAAVAWLEDNGQGAIVKRQVSLAFGKGEEQKAAEAIDVLREHHFAPTDVQSVHAQTLSAVVRELLAEGKELPMSLLGVFVQPIIRIKRAD